MRNANIKMYSDKCSVCRYMRKHDDFRRRIIQSSYFNPMARENLMDVLAAFGEPFASGTLYQHIRRHQPRDIVKAMKKYEPIPLLAPTLQVIEAEPGASTTNHEIGLDDFIQKGREKLAMGELQITATTFLQAIKIKADNEKGNKDRRLDALKTMFRGAAPSGATASAVKTEDA